MKTIQIDQDIYNYILSRTAQAGESPSTILRRELHVPQTMEIIEVDDDTYAYLLSKTVTLGESASTILRRELNLNEPPHHDPTGEIEFHIPAGTGNLPWNSPESAVVASVGNNLRIANDDTVPHRLHTSGIPFPHPDSDIMPGQSADFVLLAPYDPHVDQPIYDHNAGSTARFWIKVSLPA